MSKPDPAAGPSLALPYIVPNRVPETDGALRMVPGRPVGRVATITLCERRDGTRVARLGKHEGAVYLSAEGTMRRERTETVAIDPPKHEATLSDFENLPGRVREFLRAGTRGASAGGERP